jgi:hypothetical protein
MEDLERYLDEFVAPTIADFQRLPASVRHGFVACVVLFHSVDYRVYPKSSTGVRQKWRRRSADFALVDKVAHAFKHVATPSPSHPQLLAENVRGRPPSIPGQMVPGLSLIGDPVGAVIVEGQNLLQVVQRAVQFLHQQR